MKATQDQCHIAPDEVHGRLAEHMLVDGFPIVLDLVEEPRVPAGGLRGRHRVSGLLHLLRLGAARDEPSGALRRPDDTRRARRGGGEQAGQRRSADGRTSPSSSPPSPACSGTRRCPTCSSSRAARSLSRTPSSARSTGSPGATRRPGARPSSGTRVLHLRHAFHGRSGYTLSLTNTDPVKTDRYPKFDWPRISSPAVALPARGPPGRGGGRRASWRSPRPRPRSRRTRTTSPASSPSPSSARAATATCGRSSCWPSRSCAIDYDALFVLDEVQTGAGATGTPWCYQQLGLCSGPRRLRQEGPARRRHGRPACGRGRRERLSHPRPDRLDLGRQPHRHGALPAPARARRTDRRHRECRQRSAGISSRRLVELEQAWPQGCLQRPRARLRRRDRPCDTRELRSAVLTTLWREEHVIAFGCGERSLRLRPALSMTADEVDAGCDAMNRVVGRLG